MLNVLPDMARGVTASFDAGKGPLLERKRSVLSHPCANRPLRVLSATFNRESLLLCYNDLKQYGNDLKQCRFMVKCQVEWRDAGVARGILRAAMSVHPTSRCTRSWRGAGPTPSLRRA